MSIKIVDARNAREVERLLSPRARTATVRSAARRAHRRGRARGGRRRGPPVRRAVRRADGRVRDPPSRLAAPRPAGRRARCGPRSERRRGHIARVAQAQLPQSTRVTVAPGITVEQRVRPLDRVGCYVPGGRYPLPSSLLMTAVPARVAGVPEIIAVCPRPEPVVLAAAEAAGVTRLFRLGGAHAIAALAFGTKSVPRVDRIVGPGQQVRRRGEELRLARSRDRHAGRPERDSDPVGQRAARLARRRPDRAGGARSRRARACSSRAKRRLAAAVRA